MSDPSVLCIPFNLMSLAFYLRSKLTPATWSRRLQIYISGYKADGFVWNIALCFYISGYIYNFILIMWLIMFTLKKIIWLIIYIFMIKIVFNFEYIYTYALMHVHAIFLIIWLIIYIFIIKFVFNFKCIHVFTWITC